MHLVHTGGAPTRYYIRPRPNPRAPLEASSRASPCIAASYATQVCCEKGSQSVATNGNYGATVEKKLTEIMRLFSLWHLQDLTYEDVRFSPNVHLEEADGTKTMPTVCHTSPAISRYA